MTIYELISEEVERQRVRILPYAALAGVTNAIALMLINSVAQAPETATLLSFLLFASVAAIAILATRHSTHGTNAIIESSLHRIKTRLVEKVERTELERIERIGSTEILERITENVTVISTSAAAIGVMLPSLCVLVFGVLYLAWLSPWALVILTPLQLAAMFLYRTMSAEADRLLEQRAKTRVQFLDNLMDLLRGAKEIRLNRARRREVLDEFQRNSAKLGEVSAKTTQIFDDSALFVTTNLYVLLGALAFVVPNYVEMTGPHLSKLVATILFLWGSVQTGLAVYPSYVQANAALANIATLEKKLDGAKKEKSPPNVQSDPWHGIPGRITAVDIEYVYPAENGDTAFRIGPINLAIEPGEIVFVVGGNGSGKSTFMKVLTGLYPPTNGILQAGNTQVLPTNVVHYREMISIIFSDFHLFSKAYGLLDVDPEAVRVLLREMQIEHKTSFEDGAFTQRNLSTGQKKRLAMILAYLDDRPIFVLDEWAADQDPEFRKHFYEEMLPALKRKGKTIIAVSHDDRYFHIADHVVIMEYGQIRTIRSKDSRTLPLTKMPDPTAERPRISETGTELS